MGPLGIQLATMCGRVIRPYLQNMKACNGTVSEITGVVDLPLEMGGILHDFAVCISPSLHGEFYLGADWVRVTGAQLDPIKNCLQLDGVAEPVKVELAADGVRLAAIGLADVGNDEREEINRLLDRLLPKEQGPLKSTNESEFILSLDGSCRPIKQKYYPISRTIEGEMHAQVRQLLEEGIIEPSNSPWSSPVVMVKKPTGKYRMCIDYRKLNAVSVLDSYPLPRMESVLRNLQRARYISTIDLSSAYR